MGEDQEDIKKTAVCVHHSDMASDIKEIKGVVHSIALRLERGDGRFVMLEAQVKGCETRLDKIDNVFTKVLIAVLIAVILGLGGLVFSGKFGGVGGGHQHDGSAQERVEK